MTWESFERWKTGMLNTRVASLFQGDVDVDAAERPEGFHLGNPLDEVCSCLLYFVFSVFRVVLTWLFIVLIRSGHVQGLRVQPSSS